MDLPKVVINGNYTDFLNGKEVEATAVGSPTRLKKGMAVMGFHNSIAVNSNVSVPREKQSQYIGVEGLVTDAGDNAAKHPRLKVVKR